MNTGPEYVKKRDGRTVPFDMQKISEAIFKAAQSVGGQDRYLADDIAEAVRMYLAAEYRDRVPSVENIQDAVERVLIKTGHAKTAKAYILYRQKRARARKIREGIAPEDLSERERERAASLLHLDVPVRRSDGNLSRWDKHRVTAALVRETSISAGIAELIVSEVEEEILSSKAENLSSSLVREMVNAKLVQYGFEEERKLHARIGLPLYDVKNLFASFSGIPDEFSVQLGRAVKREFAMNAVLPEILVEKHLRGELSVCNIEGIDKCYSAVVHAEGAGNGYKEELPRLRGLASFVEKNIFLRLPHGCPPEMAESGELAFPKALCLEFVYGKEPAVDNLFAGTPPVSVIFNGVEEFELFTRNPAQIPAGAEFSVFPGKPGDMLVFNRLAVHFPVLEAYAQQDGMTLAGRLIRLLPLCAEMLKMQEFFLSSTPAGKRFLDEFARAGRTVEVEVPDDCLSEDFLGFIEGVLDSGLCIVVRPGCSGQERAKALSDFSSLLKSLHSAGYEPAVRIANV